MSYIEDKIKVNTKLFKDGGEYAAEYLRERDTTKSLYLTGVYIRKPLLNELIKRIDPDKVIDQSLVERYMVRCEETGRLPYMWGYSVIHIDTRGLVVSGIEALLAFDQCGGDHLYMHIYFGVPIGIVDNLKIVKLTTMSATTTQPIEGKRKYDRTKREFKYSPRAIGLIMAYNKGTLDVQTSTDYHTRITQDDTITWVSKNDSTLLAECMNKSYSEAVSRALNGFLSGTEIAAVRFITSKANDSKSQDFFALLKSNYLSRKDSAISTLRRIVANKEEWSKASLFSRMSVLIQIWNYFIQDISGPIYLNLEKFPEAK